jgi:hypothetical protein
MLKSKPKTPPAPSLSIEERIQQLHQDISALIDERVEQIRRETGYELPPLMIRRDTFERGAFDCPCRQYRNFKEQG